MARKRNRSLFVERARLAQAQTNIESAWAALFPTITAQGKYTHNDHPANLPFMIPSPEWSELHAAEVRPARRQRGRDHAAASRRRPIRRSRP